MNNNPYSYDEALNIVDLCSGLELHIRNLPEAHHIRILGVNQVQKILSMNHIERINLMKEVVELL